MRRNWLFAAALAAGVAAIQPAAFAKENAAASAVEAKSPEPVRIGSLSGAFLAARIAEVDNDLDSAIAYYTRALSFDPGNQTLQQSLMLALISRGSFDQALPYAEKLKTVPEIERFSRLALAVDAIRDGKYRDAENWLKLALESDLDRLVVGIMNGWAKLGAGDAKGALTAVQALDGPEWYNVFKSFHRGLIAEQAGLRTEAAEAYKEAVDDAASGGAAPDTYLRAAEAYAGFLARSGEKAKALEALDAADRFAAGRPPIMALRKRIEAGETVPPLVADVKAGAAEVLLDLGAALNRSGGEAFVRLYLQYALALKPDGDLTLVQLAQVAEQQQDAEAAIALYERIPASSPFKRVAELQLGLNLADLDRHDEAIAHLTKLLDMQPDDMRAYVALGGVYSSEERYREAADVYDRAVAQLKSPQTADWNVFYQRGIAYERLKEWPKAEPNFLRALELFPNQPQVLNYLGYSWVDMNMNLERGLDMIRKAVDLRPNDGYIVDSLGWAYYRLGRYEEAVVELERAVSLKPDDPILNDHLGDAYWRVGRKLEATFQWAHARDMKPEPDVLAQVLDKLTKGLPAVPEKATADLPTPPPAPAAPEAAPEKRTEAAPPVEPVVPPAPAAAPAAATVEPASYRVQPGQSLWSIAVDVLGSGDRYREILTLNPQLQGDPGRIRPGQEIRLPAGSR